MSSTEGSITSSHDRPTFGARTSKAAPARLLSMLSMLSALSVLPDSARASPPPALHQPALHEPALHQPGRSSGLQDPAELWVGYSTQTRLSEPLSLSNELIFVTPGLYHLLRTGLTLHLAPELTITAGYGFLGFPLSTTHAGQGRMEHRPYVQLTDALRLDDVTQLGVRLRWEARFRRGAQEPDFALTQRVRCLVGLRRSFAGAIPGLEWRPFVTIHDELLLTLGPDHAPSLFEQNRVLAGLGVADGPLSVMVAYMLRWLNRPAETQVVTRHALVLWISHTFDLRDP